MGIEIGLAVNPEKIDSLQWQNCYLKTLKIIDDYPAMSLKSESHLGEKRLVLTSDVEKNINDLKRRHWSICGNIENNTRAETFSLYYNLDHYDTWSSYDNDDILFSYLDFDKDLRFIYKRKTQGEDYHKLILAISILIENCFPDKAIVMGDFDSEEVTEAVNWLEEIFEQKFEWPVLAAKEKLFSKLKSRFAEQDLIKNFYHFYRGDQNEMMHYFFKKLGQETVSEWLKDYLKAREYTVHSKGAIDLFILWLNESKDLESLVKMACIDEDGPQYEIKDFIEMLNDIWIFVFDEYRDYFDRFEEFEKKSNKDPFLKIYSLFLDLHISGRKTKVGFKEAELFEILEKYFPEEKSELIEFHLEKAEETKKIFDQFEELDKEELEVESEEEETDFNKEFNNFISEETQNKLKMKIEKVEKKLKNAGVETLDEHYKLLISFITEAGKALTEETWSKLDQIENVDLINFFIFMYYGHVDDRLFNLFRDYITENVDFLETELKKYKII